MSQEAKPVSSTQLFPIDLNSPWKANDWMLENLPISNEFAYKQGISEFWKRHEPLHQFQSDMAAVHRMIFGWNEQQLKSHERGFIYSVKTIESKLKQLNLSYETLAPTDLYKHFEASLMDNGDDLDMLAARTKLGILPHEILTPSRYVSGVYQNMMDQGLIDRLTKNFKTNKKLDREEFEKEKYVFPKLLDKTFNKTFGPAPGLIAGAVDGYRVIKSSMERREAKEMRENETIKLNAMWNLNDLIPAGGDVTLNT